MCIIYVWTSVMANRNHVVVVGAGAAGLAAAIRLAVAGSHVTLVEGGPEVGGKIRTARVDGLAVDAGPTVLTMREVFEELFASVGSKLDEHIALEPCDVLARHAWGDGARLDLFADSERSARAIRELAGSREAEGFARFCTYARGIWAAVEGPFVRSPKPTLGSALRMAKSLGLSGLAAIDGHRTMWNALGDFFRDRRLRQLFARYATYCGSSPWEAPATLNLVAAVEARGVHRVRGGMGAVVRALKDLAERCGVSVVTNAQVSEVVIRGGRALGVHVAGQGELAADVVVVATDVAALAQGALGALAARAVDGKAGRPRSLSAVTWAVVGEARGFPMGRHNVFFGDDYAVEFEELLQAQRVPSSPTVYVCAQDREEPADAAIGNGRERFLVVLNAPPTGDAPEQWSEQERERWDKAAFSTMARCGLTLAPAAVKRTTPVEFHQAFPGSGGALYGPRSTGPLSPFSRQGASTKVPGLYLAGGSVHPGPGVPMAVLSGQLCAERLIADLALTNPCRPVATSGTTSML